MKIAIIISLLSISTLIQCQTKTNHKLSDLRTIRNDYTNKKEIKNYLETSLIYPDKFFEHAKDINILSDSLVVIELTRDIRIYNHISG